MEKFETLPQVRQIDISADQLRSFEAEVARVYESGEIKGPIHLSDGNEGELIKVFKKISSRDFVFSSWRSHYHAILHDIPMDSVFDEIMQGRSMGLMFDDPFIYSSSIVGGTIPAALGAAAQFQRDGSGRKAWLFVGDMTARMGVFWEAYNFAHNFDLPLQIVIEDNSKSVTTDTAKCWGGPLHVPELAYAYKFESRYPHHGSGKWVNF